MSRVSDSITKLLDGAAMLPNWPATLADPLTKLVNWGVITPRSGIENTQLESFTFRSNNFVIELDTFGIRSGAEGTQLTKCTLCSATITIYT